MGMLPGTKTKESVMYKGDTDLSPRAQADLVQRSEVSARLERKRIEDYTNEDLQAILAVSGLWCMSSFRQSQPYAYLRRCAKGSGNRKVR